MMQEVPKGPQGQNTMQTYLENGRLQLVANVDLNGARRLARILPLLIKCIEIAEGRPDTKAKR